MIPFFFPKTALTRSSTAMDDDMSQKSEGGGRGRRGGGMRWCFNCGQVSSLLVPFFLFFRLFQGLWTV